MRLPDYPQPKQPLEASWGRAVIDYLRSITLSVDRGLERDWLPGGTTLRLRSKATAAGGAPAEIKPFQLIVVKVDDLWKIRVVESTLAGGGSEELGFAEGDDPQYLLDAEEGVLVGGITYDVATRYVTSRWLEILPEFPTEIEDGTGYVQIGTIAGSGANWTATNSRYGPITAEIWRNWFAAEAPFFNVIWL